MTQQHDETAGTEELDEQGVAIGMGEEQSTFEPEEDPDALDEPRAGGTLTYEQEAGASLEATGHEEPSTIDYGDGEEHDVVPDELREVPVDPEDEALPPA